MQWADDVLSCLKGLNEMKNYKLQWSSLHTTAVLLSTQNFCYVKCWWVGCSWYSDGPLCLQNAENCWLIEQSITSQKTWIFSPNKSLENYTQRFTVWQSTKHGIPLRIKFEHNLTFQQNGSHIETGFNLRFSSKMVNTTLITWSLRSTWATVFATCFRVAETEQLS